MDDLTTRLPTFSLKGIPRPEAGPGAPLDPPRLLKYLTDHLPPSELGRLNEALVAAGDAIGGEFIEAHVSSVTQRHHQHYEDRHREAEELLKKEREAKPFLW